MSLEQAFFNRQKHYNYPTSPLFHGKPNIWLYVAWFLQNIHGETKTPLNCPMAVPTWSQAAWQIAGSARPT